jgi:lysophospholipase L1-like esterase
MTIGLVVGFLAFVCGCDDSSEADINYTALGASDAFGVGATPLTNGYVYLVEEGIEQRTAEGVDLDNLGIPGAEIGEIDNLELQLLRTSPPDLITISTGANDLIDGDSIDGFESDLNGMLNKLRTAAPQAVVVLSNIPDLTKVERFVENPDRNVTTDRLLGYNGAITRQASAHNAYLVDLYAIPLNDSLVSDVDGFHPNDRGHRVIAHEFLKVIEPLLPIQ